MPKLHAYSLILILPFASAVLADQEQAEDFERYLKQEGLDYSQDWLQLESGEILQGDLDEYYGDKVQFDSDKLKTLQIDLDKIWRIRTAGEFRVNLRDLGVHRGQLVLDDNWLTIVNEREIKVERSQIISIYPVRESEAERWETKISLGANFSSGNSNSMEINGKLNTERKTVTNRTIVDYIGVLTETENVTTARNHRITASHDIYRSTRMFIRPINADFYHAPLQNIQLQTQLSSQVGYIAVDESEKRWEVSFGPTWQNTRFTDVEASQNQTEQSLGATARSKFEMDLNDRMELIHDYSITLSKESTGGLQHHNVLGLEIELTDLMDFDVDFIWDYTQSPQADSEGNIPKQSDYRLVFGLGIDF